MLRSLTKVLCIGVLLDCSGSKCITANSSWVGTWQWLFFFVQYKLASRLQSPSLHGRLGLCLTLMAATGPIVSCCNGPVWPSQRGMSRSLTFYLIYNWVRSVIGSLIPATSSGRESTGGIFQIALPLMNELGHQFWLTFTFFFQIFHPRLFLLSSCRDIVLWNWYSKTAKCN